MREIFPRTFLAQFIFTLFLFLLVPPGVANAAPTTAEEDRALRGDDYRYEEVLFLLYQGLQSKKESALPRIGTPKEMWPALVGSSFTSELETFFKEEGGIVTPNAILPSSTRIAIIPTPESKFDIAILGSEGKIGQRAFYGWPSAKFNCEIQNLDHQALGNLAKIIANIECVYLRAARTSPKFEEFHKGSLLGSDLVKEAEALKKVENYLATLLTQKFILNSAVEVNGSVTLSIPRVSEEEANFTALALTPDLVNRFQDILEEAKYEQSRVANGLLGSFLVLPLKDNEHAYFVGRESLLLALDKIDPAKRIEATSDSTASDSEVTADSFADPRRTVMEGLGITEPDGDSTSTPAPQQAGAGAGNLQPAPPAPGCGTFAVDDYTAPRDVPSNRNVVELIGGDGNGATEEPTTNGFYAHIKTALTSLSYTCLLYTSPSPRD